MPRAAASRAPCAGPQPPEPRAQGRSLPGPVHSHPRARSPSRFSRPGPAGASPIPAAAADAAGAGGAGASPQAPGTTASVSLGCRNKWPPTGALKPQQRPLSLAKVTTRGDKTQALVRAALPPEALRRVHSAPPAASGGCPRVTWLLHVSPSLACDGLRDNPG